MDMANRICTSALMYLFLEVRSHETMNFIFFPTNLIQMNLFLKENFVHEFGFVWLSALVQIRRIHDPGHQNGLHISYGI